MISIHASSWPQKLHHLMDNRKYVKINENWRLVEFLPKHKTVAVYCFLPLHLTVHVHPITTSARGGRTIRFTGKVHTVWSMSKWRSAWVGSSMELLIQKCSMTNHPGIKISCLYVISLTGLLLMMTIKVLLPMATAFYFIAAVNFFHPVLFLLRCPVIHCFGHQSCIT